MEKLNKRKSKRNSLKKRLKDIRRMRKSDLTSGMVRVIIFCWLVPYLTLSVVLFYSSESRTNDRINDTVTSSMENAAEVCKTNIQDAINESKNASYDGVIKESYIEFLKDGDETKMYNTVKKYLDNAYRYSSIISCTMLMFNRITTKEYYTYSNIAGSTYASINYFRMNAMSTVRNVARELGTGTKFVSVGGHLYLVRNIVTSDYTPFAMLVMEINVDNVFKSMGNVVWRQNGLIYIDGELVKSTDNFEEGEKESLIEYAEINALDPQESGIEYGISNYNMDEGIANLTMKVNNQKVTFVVKLDKIRMLNEKSTAIYTYVIIVILLIPLLFATFYYFYNNISRPISDLVFASEKIEDGEYGYKIEDFNRNEEFKRLIDTFNHMSMSLEESFNRIYAEEIAVRDANMHALQSQINPHFLNNTLEIINWKARMSGNDDVSEMIESLGVMMEATMNRKNESFITIREEMKYVDAYLYIIVQRFGRKFEFEKEIDEELLDLKIPRLIIQPLVENMVEHGGDVYGNRIGKLKIFANMKYLHIVVENNGNISEEDAKKIQMLLNETDLDSVSQNIGIRNVNLRLKLLYGEQSGLTISNPEEELTVSEIVIERKKIE